MLVFTITYPTIRASTMSSQSSSTKRESCTHGSKQVRFLQTSALQLSEAWLSGTRRGSKKVYRTLKALSELQLDDIEVTANLPKSEELNAYQRPVLRAKGTLTPVHTAYTKDPTCRYLHSVYSLATGLQAEAWTAYIALTHLDRLKYKIATLQRVQGSQNGHLASLTSIENCDEDSDKALPLTDSSSSVPRRGHRIADLLNSE